MMEPQTPALEYVFTISAQIDRPRSGGKSALGERLHIPIIGGTVSGPRLEGEILPDGSDWPLIRPDGCSEINAHYSIKAADGTLIYAVNSGLRVSSPDVLARLRAGDEVAPSEYYFRTQPRFDVPDGPHQWLREHLFVGSAMPKGRSVEISVFMVN